MKGTKSPGKLGCKRPGNKHNPQMKRWLVRKEESAEQREQDRILVVQELGSRRKAAKSFCRMNAARANKEKEEREMLANTSLKDLIQ